MFQGSLEPISPHTLPACKPGDCGLFTHVSEAGHALTATCLFSCSKKILTLDMKQDPPPHPNTLRLQRMIRYSATLFVQVKPPLSTTQRVDRAHGLLVLCSYTYCSLGLHVCQPHLEKNLHVKGK